MMNFDALKQLDISPVNPISVPMETIEVEVSSARMFDNFSKSFIAEGRRVNPLLAEQVNLTIEEMSAYCDYLLVKRVETVHQTCKDWRKLKVLYIPCWIQYVLCTIGEVNRRDIGIRLWPVTNIDETITFDQALAISDKVGAFINDLQIVRDAMPRGIEGDPDVMSTAMVDGYIRALNRVSHPVATYASAFMGLKLREEQAFKALYRVQYDDLEFIRTALLYQKGLY